MTGRPAMWNVAFLAIRRVRARGIFRVETLPTSL